MGGLSSGLRVLTRLTTAVAAVVAYVALVLAVLAGIDLRHALAFHDAPAQAAAFLAAIDRGDVSGTRAIEEWFSDRAPSPGRSWASTSLAAADVARGEPALAHLFADDLAVEVEQDQRVLDEEFEASWAVAVPWLVVAAVLVASALLLRHRRRSANAEVVEVVSRFTPPRPRWRRPVFLVVSGGGYTLLVVGFLAGVTATRTSGIPWTSRGLILLGGAVALVAAFLVLRYSRPRSARDAVRAIRADWRKPVLYLRGFGDDRDSAAVDELPGALSAGLLSIHSREEQLVGALGAFGPVIAVGRPGEPLPHLGAARFYLPFDDWQPGVLRLMELSQLIVLRLGEGDGLWWEVDRARATQPAAKLVLLVPGRRDGLAERLDEHLPKPSWLDEVVGGQDRWTSAVITFHDDWTPEVVPVGPFPGQKNSTATPVHHVVRALRAALEAVGVRKRSMSWRVGGGILANFGKVLLLVPGFVLAFLLMRLVFLW